MLGLIAVSVVGFGTLGVLGHYLVRAGRWSARSRLHAAAALTGLVTVAGLWFAGFLGAGLGFLAGLAVLEVLKRRQVR